MSGEIPFAGHPSLGTAVAVARARGEARGDATSSRRRAGLQPVDVELDGLGARASMLQEPAAFGAGARSRRGARRLVGLDAGGRRPASCPARSSPPASLRSWPRRATPTRSRRARARLEGIGALLAGHGAIVLYLLPSTRAAGRARARFFMRPGGDGRGPGDGVGGRPAVRLPGRAHGRAADRRRPGRRDGPPEPAGSARSRATASASAATPWSWPRDASIWTLDRSPRGPSCCRPRLLPIRVIRPLGHLGRERTGRSASNSRTRHHAGRHTRGIPPAPGRSFARPAIARSRVA